MEKKKFVYSLMLYGDPWVDLGDLALPLVLWDEDFHWHFGMREVYLSDECVERSFYFLVLDRYVLYFSLKSDI
jgi:hypothetical protein